MGLKKSGLLSAFRNLSASVGFNSKTGFSATANYSLTGKDPNHNPKTFGGLALSLDRTGANLGVSVDGANLANSHSVHGFSMNENFASDRTNNLILSRANEAFDAEMDARVLTAENDYLKSKTKPPMSDSELVDLNKPENRANKEARLKQIGAVDPNNKAKTTSRITDESKAYGEIADGFRNLGAAFGIAGRASGQSGFVDAEGKFHPRTCFVAGTLVTIVKREYRGTVISQLDSIEPDTRYEEKVAIETVKIGDYVLSWDETTKAKSYKKVTELFHHEVKLLYNLEIQSGEIIQSNWNHPFYVVREEVNNRSTTKTGGWVEAKDLKAGDKFLNSSGNIVQLKSIIQENQHELISVFNFEVDQTHTYYVDRDEVLTHNCPTLAGAGLPRLAGSDSLNQLSPDAVTSIANKTAELATNPAKAGKEIIQEVVCTGMDCDNGLPGLPPGIKAGIGIVDKVLRSKIVKAISESPLVRKGLDAVKASKEKIAAVFGRNKEIRQLDSFTSKIKRESDFSEKVNAKLAKEKRDYLESGQGNIDVSNANKEAIEWNKAVLEYKSYIPLKGKYDGNRWDIDSLLKKGGQHKSGTINPITNLPKNKGTEYSILDLSQGKLQIKGIAKIDGDKLIVKGLDVRTLSTDNNVAVGSVGISKIRSVIDELVKNSRLEGIKSIELNFGRVAGTNQRAVGQTVIKINDNGTYALETIK